MKVLKIILAILAAAYAVAGVVQCVSIVTSTGPSSTYGTAQIAASIAPPLIGVVFSIALFRSAFNRSAFKKRSDSSDAVHVPLLGVTKISSASKKRSDSSDAASALD